MDFRWIDAVHEVNNKHTHTCIFGRLGGKIFISDLNGHVVRSFWMETSSSMGSDRRFGIDFVPNFISSACGSVALPRRLLLCLSRCISVRSSLSCASVSVCSRRFTLKYTYKGRVTCRPYLTRIARMRASSSSAGLARVMSNHGGLQHRFRRQSLVFIRSLFMDNFSITFIFILHFFFKAPPLGCCRGVDMQKEGVLTTCCLNLSLPWRWCDVR